MHTPTIVVLLVVALAASLLNAAAQPTPTSERQVLIIAHRGASGHRPEHTLASYDLAIDMGADYIEPDLVMTRDRHLIARHEPTLAVVHPQTGAVIEETTDVRVRPEFASRKRTRELDGKQVTGWWSDDFTLAEIKTLRAVERLPDLRPGSAAFNGKFEIATLEEIIRLAKKRSVDTGRTIGIYPETKHPSFFDAIFGPHAMDDALLAELKPAFPDAPDAPVFIQSFEVSNLQYLRTRSRLPLIQLLSATGRPYDFEVAHDRRTYADLITPVGLKFISSYANGIGPEKSMVIPRDASGALNAPSPLVADAHAAGLLVHPYTLRAENKFLPSNLRKPGPDATHGDLEAESRAFFAAGVDGFFTDFPDIACRVRGK